MAIGSWAKTPLYPGFSEISKIIEAQMTTQKLARQLKEESSEDLDEDMEAEELDSDEQFFTT